MSAERWLPIAGYEGSYEVSSLGRVRSLSRTVERRNRGPLPIRERILVAALNSRGRPTVSLHAGGSALSYQVSALVAEAFIGPRPSGMNVLHWDDNPLDNRVENLRYGTYSDNQHDRVRNGRHVGANKVECKWGHRFTPENTYTYPKTGLRACRQCMRDRRKTRYVKTGS